MWIQKSENIVPLLPFSNEYDFWHNSQTNTLPEVFIQNGKNIVGFKTIGYEGFELIETFEIFKASNITKYNSITGKNIVGFNTIGYEGFDINTEYDFIQAKKIIETL